MLAWIWCLFQLTKAFGFGNLVFLYIVPYLVCHHWLTTITFLQHTDWDVDRYSSAEWTWLRGAFGTIDRDYGAFLNFTFHHLTDSHVIHHLFSKMPNYNAIRATQFLKDSKTFGKYYCASKETWYGALWNIIGRARWIKTSEHIMRLKEP